MKKEKECTQDTCVECEDDVNEGEENEGHLVGIYLWLSPELKDATQADVPNASRSRKRWCEYCACDQTPQVSKYVHTSCAQELHVHINLSGIVGPGGAQMNPSNFDP